MATVDIRGDVIEALRSTDGARAIAGAVAPVVREAVREALAAAGHDGWLDARTAAQYLGLTRGAWKQRRRRHPSLDALALGEGRSRRWRRADLDAWLRARGGR